MIVSMIVAHGNDCQIGLDNQMLWHIPEDFKNFRSLTMGKAILMGRKTYESIGRPLPGRLNIVLSSNPDSFNKKNQIVGELQAVSSFEEALDLAKKTDKSELVICGGGEIYLSYQLRATKLYLSRVDFDGRADTYFPKISSKDWRQVEKKEYVQTDRSPKWSFEILMRV